MLLTSAAHVAVGVAGLVERRLAVLGERQVWAGQRVHCAGLQHAALGRALGLQCLLARKVFVEARGARHGDGSGDDSQAEGHCACG